MTEDEARTHGRNFDVKRNDMGEWRSPRTRAETTAFAKVLVEKARQRYAYPTFHSDIQFLM